jgi:DNA sulfur modification protein DndD
MATILRILGWKAVGLRCPDHEIDCCNSHGVPHAISLIQMPNGTGKTTTLALLRAAFSGAASDEVWNRAYVRELRKDDESTKSGSFELRLSLNDKRLTIIMELDFESGTVDYKTTFGSGQEEGFHPPLEVRRFMNEDFVNFYIFDGELADHLLSNKFTDAEKAVESLFQVHLLDKMAQKVQEYWDDKTQSVTAKDEKGYTRRKNRLDKWRGRLSAVIREKSDLDKRLKNVSQQHKRQQDRYEKEIKKETERADRVRNADATVKNYKQQTRDCARAILDNMRQPNALSPVFAVAMYDLKAGLDRVKLPESAAREFFEELTAEKECICGRPIDDLIRATIKDRAHHYLGSDDVFLLNSMKSAVSESVGESPQKAYNELGASMETLSTIVSSLHTAENDLSELKTAVERSDPEVMKAKEEIDRLAREREQIVGQLQRFEGKDLKVRIDRIDTVDPDRVWAVATIQDVVKFLEVRLAEVANTLTLKQKKDILTDIIKKAHALARQSIALEIRDDANQRIAALMPYNNIRIDRIDSCLVLRGRSGGSVGETLSVAYAFLSTLFSRADQHQLPFVVDSPANPIDYEIRTKIGELIPSLAGQFIGFVISSEREKFLPSVKKASNGDIQFVTLFRKGATHHEARAEACHDCVKTADGFRVGDESFFNEFQLDTEEA